MSDSVFNKEDMAQESVTSASCFGETGYFVTDSNDIVEFQRRRQDELRRKQDKEKAEIRKSGAWAILSVVTAIIPICLWIYCLVASGGSTSEAGPGVVWWYVVMYYWTVGFPLAISSFIFGVMGLKTRLWWLSIVGLSIKIVTIICIVLLSFVH